MNIASSADLQYLREEEKLARDVYLFAAAQYPQAQIFQNIAASEQKHMDKTLTLLNLYGLSDPAANQAEGVFTNQFLSNLYDELTAKAAISISDALWVGATIEDLDIYDISEMEKSEQLSAEMLALYSQLSCGSRNHLRAFTSQLALHELMYEPQYISIEVYQNILNGQHENCNQP